MAREQRAESGRTEFEGLRMRLMTNTLASSYWKKPNSLLLRPFRSHSCFQIIIILSSICKSNATEIYATLAQTVQEALPELA